MAIDPCSRSAPHATIGSEGAGIVIAEEPYHNQIVYARCACIEWSGNDCSIPPPPPPTVQPWPDPTPMPSAAGRRARRGSWGRRLLMLPLLLAGFG